MSLAVATDSTVGVGNFTYDSLTPLGSLVALVNMQLGEVAFGGVGSGLFGMLAFVLLTVFIAGLLVGRTPEYLGNKLKRREITLVFWRFSRPNRNSGAGRRRVRCAAGTRDAIQRRGARGFSELFYAFTSSAAGNGSAFGGLGVNTVYNFATDISMLVGRYAVIIPT